MNEHLAALAMLIARQEMEIARLRMENARLTAALAEREPAVDVDVDEQAEL